ncbi:MAG: glutathione S-transferase C-terminal domain-containing protein [Myxococcota bacterium]
MARRIPWSSPTRPGTPRLDGAELVVDLADPWGHALAICHRWGASEIALRDRVEPPTDRAHLPLLLEPDGALRSDDLLGIAEALAPSLFAGLDLAELVAVRERLIDPVYPLGQEADQARYEASFAALRQALLDYEAKLRASRYLGGNDEADLSFADVVLYGFLVRLDPVYYELFKANAFLLTELPSLEGYCRDLYERPPFFESTDFDRIKAGHYLDEPVLNPKRIIPRGGLPRLDVPHDRHRFTSTESAGGTEDATKHATTGEFVRPASGLRHWIRPDGERYPAEAGRYHLYAPYNCPWSHRALLARAVKGLDDVVGASVVYFRRHPERGWQFNPKIPGCTPDELYGRRFAVELYESVGSKERSVPILWDAQTESIVSNESAEILRMFNDAFGSLAQSDLDLYPEDRRAEIDRLNEIVYQRVNNGAYKAGFASSQEAYDRAFARYFAALDWLEALLAERRWLAGSERFTEADLRLFPTLFRHDAVYFTRFRLNLRRIVDYPRLAEWLKRMLAMEPIARASNLDHARNGYFGRTGNEVVPAGPVPLGLSPSQFERDVWLGDAWPGDA